MDRLPHFQRRMAETIAWCASKDWASNPTEGLRSPELRPPEPQDRDEMILPWKVTPQQRQEIVEQVATKRAKLLQEQGVSPFQLIPPLIGGRLLAFVPDDTLFDGAAEAGSDGFFDGDNIPPWDTWIAYVTNDSATAVSLRWRHPTTSYLLSWVPEPLIEAATNGLDVNPEECILWATDMDSAFMRQLRQAGLLR